MEKKERVWNKEKKESVRKRKAQEKRENRKGRGRRKWEEKNERENWMEIKKERNVYCSVVRVAVIGLESGIGKPSSISGLACCIQVK